jgi:hypothetical protein
MKTITGVDELRASYEPQETEIRITRFNQL